MRREKSISVRFAAVGGQAVKAEFRDIGTTGRAAMAGVVSGTGAANDNLEEFALRASQARQKLEDLAQKSAATASQLRTTAQPSSPVQARVNQATGVTTPTGMSTVEILRQGQALDDVRAKINPLFAVIRQYRSELSEFRAAHLEGAISSDELADAIARIRPQALATIDRLKGITVAANAKEAAIKAAADADVRAAADAAKLAAAMDAQRAKYNPLFAVISQYRSQLAGVRDAQTAGSISDNEAAAAIGKYRRAALQAIDGIKGTTAALNAKKAAQDAAAGADKQAASALDALRAKYNPMFAVISRYKAEQAGIRQAHKDGALSADEMKAALDRLRTASLSQIATLKGQSQHIEQVSRSTRGATLRMQNLTYQLNDIGVTLAGGMNPFMIMAQQGPQIAQIYGFGNGGVSQIFKDMGGMLLKIPTPIKAIGLAAGLAAIGIRDMRDEINKTSDVTVTFGDVGKAVFQVLGRRIYSSLEGPISWISDKFDWVWERVKKATTRTGNDVIRAVQLAAIGVQVAIDVVPGLFQAAFWKGLAHVQLAMAGIVKSVRDALNFISSGFNSVFGTNLGAPAGMTEFGVGLVNDSNASWMKGESVKTGDFGAEFSRRAAGVSKNPMGDFFNDVSDQAQVNARKRLEEDDKKGGGKKAKAAKAEKDEVADLIKKLQEELLVLRETDPVKKRLLGYSEQMAEATAEERKQIEDLVATLDKAEHGWEAVGRALADYAQESKRLGGELGDSFVKVFDGAGDAFASMVQGNSSGWRDMVNQMAADWAKLAFQQHVGGPLAQFASSWLGSFGSSGDLLTDGLNRAGAAAALPSFAGGGSTGNGPRTGGLDGKGGFHAILHPQEVVEDLTKPRRRRSDSGGGGGHVSVGVDPKNGNITAYIDDRISAALPQAFDSYSRQALPYAIRQHMADPRSVG